MSRKNTYFLTIMITGVLLCGCSGGKFAEEVEKNEEKNAEMQTEKKVKEAAEDKAQKDFYKELEKPIETVIKENELDTVQIVESIEYDAQDSYKVADIFAKHVSNVLYKFYTLQINAEEYYKFLTKYGSGEVVKSLPTKDDAITILTTIQDMYRAQNITGESYTLTTVKFDRLKREGSFYRKVLTTNGEEYFVTTIVKENGVWKYSDDSPSPPYIENSEGTLKEEGANNNKGVTTNDN